MAVFSTFSLYWFVKCNKRKTSKHQNDNSRLDSEWLCSQCMLNHCLEWDK